MIKIQKLDSEDKYSIFYKNIEIGDSTDEKGRWVDLNIKGYKLVKDLHFNQVHHPILDFGQKIFR